MQNPEQYNLLIYNSTTSTYSTRLQYAYDLDKPKLKIKMLRITTLIGKLNDIFLGLLQIVLPNRSCKSRPLTIPCTSCFTKLPFQVLWCISPDRVLVMIGRRLEGDARKVFTKANIQSMSGRSLSLNISLRGQKARDDIGDIKIAWPDLGVDGMRLSVGRRWLCSRRWCWIIRGCMLVRWSAR